MEFESGKRSCAVYFQVLMSKMATSILIASNNANKLQEFREMFAQFGAGHINLITPRDLGIALDPDETGETYIENALIKARAFHGLIRKDHAQTLDPSLWVMADDSGLEVDALDGAPGLRSARYIKNAPNNDGCAALLQALAGVPEGERTARFRAVIVLIAPNGEEHIFQGIGEGSIGFDKRGSGGFGFDPIFRSSGSSQHMAELSPGEKHRISHRGLAAVQVIEFLRTEAGGTPSH